MATAVIPNAENSPVIVPVSLHVYTDGERHVPTEYGTIWDALDAAVGGDELILEPGTYSAGDGISMMGKPVTIRSIDPQNPAIVAATIIVGPGFYFTNGEDSNSVVDGLTITPNFLGFGRGILCQDSSPTIRNCIIRDCFSWAQGGGISLENSNSLIENCIIKNNTSYEISKK